MAREPLAVVAISVRSLILLMPIRGLVEGGLRGGVYMPGAARSVIRKPLWSLGIGAHLGHAMPGGITLGLTIAEAAKRKPISFHRPVGGPRGFELPTYHQLIY
jgi:hypothetical protein